MLIYQWGIFIDKINFQSLNEQEEHIPFKFVTQQHRQIFRFSDGQKVSTGSFILSSAESIYNLTKFIGIVRLGD